MSSSASVSSTIVTAAVTLTVVILVARSILSEQLEAMQQCQPSCQLGGPFLSGPWELVAPALLLLGVLLLGMSLVAGWPIASAQMRL